MKPCILCLAILILLEVLWGCEKIGLCRPQSWNSTFVTDKRIDTLKAIQSDTAFDYYQFQLKEGNSLVFQQVYSFGDCPNIADDEGSTALQHAKTLGFYSCECYPAGAVLLKEGFIEGEKVSDSRWQIKASIKLSQNDSRSIQINDIF